MLRIGECSRCGQCCGADGSPYQDSPWPDSWPEAVRTWTVQSLADNCPIFTLVGHPALGGATAAVARIGSTNYSFRWVPGHGLCRNKPPLNDPNTWSEECPFLDKAEPDGSRPCGLVGTRWQPIFDQMCFPESFPPLEAMPQWVAKWKERHPLCGYEWM